MSNTYDVLREKREAFRTFRESVVRPKLGLDDQELDNLSPQETASLILRRGIMECKHPADFAVDVLRRANKGPKKRPCVWLNS